MKACPFCLENQQLRVAVLYEDDMWYFTDVDEADGATNAGLAITKRHIETPFEINEMEWQALHTLLPKFKEFIDEREQPHGYNLGWNVYPTGGQTVAHAHLHIAARYDDEEHAGKGIRYQFKSFRNPRKSKT